MYGDPQENNFVQLRERSRQGRDQYEQDVMQRAEEQKRSGGWAPWALDPVTQARNSLSNEKAQANFMPGWDAWLQGMKESNTNPQRSYNSLVQSMRSSL